MFLFLPSSSNSTCTSILLCVSTSWVSMSCLLLELKEKFSVLWKVCIWKQKIYIYVYTYVCTYYLYKWELISFDNWQLSLIKRSLDLTPSDFGWNELWTSIRTFFMHLVLNILRKKHLHIKLGLGTSFLPELFCTKSGDLPLLCLWLGVDLCTLCFGLRV